MVGVPLGSLVDSMRSVLLGVSSKATAVAGCGEGVGVPGWTAVVSIRDWIVSVGFPVEIFRATVLVGTPLSSTIEMSTGTKWVSA